MDRYLSCVLFSANLSDVENPTKSTHRQTTAREAGFKEQWLQDAIVKDPEIVLSPCRAADLVDKNERWTFWGKEVSVKGAGSIDVLLASESGRVAIVETKLAYNPEARREVVAQVLEYAVYLGNTSLSDLPIIPQVNGTRIDRDDLLEEIKEPLLIIAGDVLDPRAVKLSNALLGKHMIYGWDLALVEVSIFRTDGPSAATDYLLVPHLCGAITVEERHVVRVVIDADRTRVDVEQAAGTVTENRQQWNEERFFAEAQRAPAPVLNFATGLQTLRASHADIRFDFGRGKTPTLILRRRNETILILRLDGFLGFTLQALPRALGENAGAYYRQRLEALFPTAMKMAWPSVKLVPETQDRDLRALLSVLQDVLGQSDSMRSHSMEGQSS